MKLLEMTKHGFNVTWTDEISISLIQSMGGDQMIAAAAWASTDPNEGLRRSIEKPEDVSGIIRYLMANKHGTPFEHNAMSFSAHCPIKVYREWHRHRIGMSYNEESGRYKTLDPVFYLPSRERPMMKVDNWKAGKPKFLTLDEHFNYEEERDYVYDTLTNNLKQSYILSYKNYLDNLKLDVDPGLARDCLPVGIYSSQWCTCNARSLMSFCSLRVHEPTAMHVSHPLYEINVAASKMEDIFKELFPITHAAYVKNGRVAP